MSGCFDSKATTSHRNMAAVVAANADHWTRTGSWQIASLYRASPNEPRIIDRPSSATEGAAPNSPAKLFGRRISPSTAKAETTIPPARKRMRYSIGLFWVQECGEAYELFSTFCVPSLSQNIHPLLQAWLLFLFDPRSLI